MYLFKGIFFHPSFHFQARATLSYREWRHRAWSPLHHPFLKITAIYKVSCKCPHLTLSFVWNSGDSVSFAGASCDITIFHFNHDYHFAPKWDELVVEDAQVCFSLEKSQKRFWVMMWQRECSGNKKIAIFVGMLLYFWQFWAHIAHTLQILRNIYSRHRSYTSVVM